MNSRWLICFQLRVSSLYCLDTCLRVHIPLLFFWRYRFECLVFSFISLVFLFWLENTLYFYKSNRYFTKNNLYAEPKFILFYKKIRENFYFLLWFSLCMLNYFYKKFAGIKHSLISIFTHQCFHDRTIQPNHLKQNFKNFSKLTRHNYKKFYKSKLFKKMVWIIMLYLLIEHG